MRISDSERVKGFLFSETDLTLENVKFLEIAPYNLSYNGIQDHFLKSDLNPKLENRAFRVMDFTPSEESYRIMDPKEFDANRHFEIGSGQSGNPVGIPVYFGGTVEFDVFEKRKSEDKNVEGMESYSIIGERNGSSSEQKVKKEE